MGDDEAVFSVVLRLPDIHLPKRLGLDRVDDLDFKTLFQQIPVHTQPVMAGSFHANEQAIIGDTQPLEQRQQLFTAFLTVGKGDAVQQGRASLIDDRGLMLVFGNVDPTVEHGETSCFKISDRVSSRFFAGHNLVRYAAHLRYPAHSRQPAKTEAQFFLRKLYFKETTCALCLLALLSHMACGTTSGFHAVSHCIQTVNLLYEERKDL